MQRRNRVKQTELLCWMKLSIWLKVGKEDRWGGSRGTGERRRDRLATRITLIVRNMATGRIRNRTIYRDLTRTPQKQQLPSPSIYYSCYPYGAFACHVGAEILFFFLAKTRSPYWEGSGTPRKSVEETTPSSNLRV